MNGSKYGVRVLEDEGSDEKKRKLEIEGNQ